MRSVKSHQPDQDYSDCKQWAASIQPVNYEQEIAAKSRTEVKAAAERCQRGAFTAEPTSEGEKQRVSA